MHLLCEPDPKWRDLAAVEAQLWTTLIGPALIACHHIGSTSVPDLAAKPVIDLLPVITSAAAFLPQSAALTTAGYEAMGAFGLQGRLYFRKNAPDGTRMIQAHVYVQGDPSITRHIAFRDLLRADVNVRQSYDAMKRRADTDSKGDIHRYMDIKDPWITKYERIALENDSA